MAPPSVRMAVTVAPATGNFAAFLTIPTIAPDDTLTVGALAGGESDASARTVGSKNAVAAADNRKLCRCLFINGIPYLLRNSKKLMSKVKPRRNRDSAALIAVAVYGRSRQ